jgi:hypothetical protein
LAHETFGHGYGRTDQIAWACVGFFFAEGDDVVYVGDFEHGACELFRKAVKEREAGR